MQASSGEAPRLLYVKVPTELIVTEGKPDVVPSADTDGLGYVANTESPLVQVGDNWYYLTAGRWFTSGQLEQGPWTWVAELPEAFSRIPEGHPMAAVLASVPGTEQAKMAALEASLPMNNVVSETDTPEVEVSYAGEPKFEAGRGHPGGAGRQHRLRHSRVRGYVLLCYGGAWYVADARPDPGRSRTRVPAAIYEIPPSSPAYNTTQVKVASTASAVAYTYPASYSSGVYVIYGVPYYGTGWYYPPYYYGGYYYPYWGIPMATAPGTTPPPAATARARSGTGPMAATPTPRATTPPVAATAGLRLPGTVTSGAATARPLIPAPASAPKPAATTTRTTIAQKWSAPPSAGTIG